MNEIFKRVRAANPPRSNFDLSHERKLSLDMGRLAPVLLQEVIPGDTFNINTETMIRFSPLVSPVMHRIHNHLHYFFVPNRILMNNPTDWEKFLTKDPAITIPQINLKNRSVPVGSLADYMGLPTVPSPTVVAYDEYISQLPFRAYLKIWNDFYRNSRIQTEIDYKDDTTVLNALGADLLSRNYEDDYFTTSTPYAQYGAIPAHADVTYNSLGGQSLVKRIGGAQAAAGNIKVAATGELEDASSNDIYIDQSNTAHVTAEEIRRAEAMQRVLEKLARAGNRYKDWLLSFFGVESDDGRLDMAEYLGGAKTPVIVSEVLNQTGVLNATDGEPLGTMGGHAINVGKKYDCTYTAKEHGWIMAIMSVLPEPAYQSCLPRHFKRLLESDFPLPEYAQLGEQGVYRKELYYNPTDSGYSNSVFGYQPRYQEYKTGFSSVHGQFRDTLKFWHLGRIFNPLAPPQLNDDFIQADPADFTRIFAITDIAKTEQLYAQVYHNISASRLLPYYADPKIS